MGTTSRQRGAPATAKQGLIRDETQFEGSKVSTKKHTYWAVRTESNGIGGFHEIKAEAEQELEMIMEHDPDESAILISRRMTAKAYESLPEFPGW